MIKLLHTEPMRGGTRVFFLAGNRCIEKLSSTYDVERKLTKLLRLYFTSNYVYFYFMFIFLEPFLIISL